MTVSSQPEHAGVFDNLFFHSALWAAYVLLAALPFAAGQVLPAQTRSAAGSLELARPVRAWQATDAVGPQSAWLGTEAGQFEAWVYPLKIVRNLHLVFHAEGQTLEAAPLARTVIARPESTTIVYASDTFRVRETLLAPVDKSGLLILLETETTAPMEIEARFERDFQLEWPAVLSSPDMGWNPQSKRFEFSCERPGYEAILGSPSAQMSAIEYATNYSSSHENGFRLGVSPAGTSHHVLALAASVHSAAEADATYKALLANAAKYEAQAAAYYSEDLSRTVSLDLPDAQLQQAYDWARVSLTQSMVRNPLMPEGLVAGYRYTVDERRPGYDWFFGRDTLWTAFAWNAEGDFQRTRTGLDFIGRYQRADGKIPHEIPQTTPLIPPLKDNSFSYASADASPLYLIAMDDYLTRSGDSAFVRAHKDVIEKTLAYMRSTFDGRHLARNQNAGTGWVEGGTLYPALMEFYQAGLGTEALRAASRLERVLGQSQAAGEMEKEAASATVELDNAFWIEKTGRYAFGLDLQGRPMDAPSVEATVPMLYDQLPEAHVRAMLDELARPAHQADWGMRIIGADDARYEPGSYHNGSVWPLFTGWASEAEYRYHRVFAGYENLRTNALLTFAGVPGRVTEVLTGNNFQELATSTSHQTWSSAMVIEPLLRGMLGLRVDVAARTLALTPHLPADWPSVGVRNIALGDARVNMRFEQQRNLFRATVEASQAREATLELNPAFSPHARIVSVTSGGRKIDYKLEQNADDQHVRIKLKLNGERQQVEVRTAGNVALVYTEPLPELGEASHGLRLTHEFWSADHAQWNLVFEGRPGAQYEVKLVGADVVERAAGAELTKDAGGTAKLHVSIPETGAPRVDVRLELQPNK